jgi:hypothetical protein
MRVGDIINHLKERNPEEEILIAYWFQEDMGFNDEQWENLIDSEGKIDWSHDAEMFADIAEIEGR